MRYDYNFTPSLFFVKPLKTKKSKNLCKGILDFPGFLIKMKMNGSSVFQFLRLF